MRKAVKHAASRLSTLQRSASHMASRVDINEAFMVGGAAVKAADEGDSGRMVVIDRVSDDPYQCATGSMTCIKLPTTKSWFRAAGLRATVRM